MLMMLELRGFIMKEFDIYTEKALVKVFGDMVSVRGRTFHIQELDKYIKKLGIDDHYKQVILSAYEQNKKDNPNDIAVYRNQFNSPEDEKFYFLATSNQQAIGEFFSRLNQCIDKPEIDILHSKIKGLAYIALNPHLTLEQFDILFKTKQYNVLFYLAENLSISENLAFELIKIEDRNIMQNVFRNRSIGDDFIIKVLNDFPDEKGYALLEIAYLPTPLSSKVKEAFIKKIDAPHNYLDRDNFYIPAIEVFFNRSDLNDNDVDLILQSEHKQIKEILTLSQHLTLNVIDKLISLNNPIIYMGLAENPCVPVDKIMTFIDKLDRFDLEIVLRHTSRKELHRHFINTDDIEIKVALARSENIDAEILERLSDSDEDEVITALSNRRRLPIEIVKKLSLKECSKHKKRLVCDYFNYPELEDFWKNHPDNEVRKYYAELLEFESDLKRRKD